MTILIEGKKGGQKEVVDEANNKKEAKGKINYWQEMKGKGWKFSTRVVK